MNPAFEDHNVDAVLREIADVLREPSGGYGAPSWAEAQRQGSGRGSGTAAGEDAQ